MELSHEAQPFIPHPSVHAWVDQNESLESPWFWREQIIPEEFVYILEESIDYPAQADWEKSGMWISDEDVDDSNGHDYVDEEVISEVSDYE